MAVIPGVQPKIPTVVDERLKRGKSQRDDGKAKRMECLEFWRGNQYAYINGENRVAYQSVTSLGHAGAQSGKPAWRQRLTRNFIFDIVEREVSACTSRVPSYEVNPSTLDQEDIDASELGEKVLLYGYDKWRVRSATEAAIRYAIVADEGFAWPYFDNSIGPYIGEGIGQGEVCLRIYGGDEVGWEPGLSFEDSPWHFIEQARDIESVYQMEGFNGTNLTPDAQNDKGGKSKLVLVTDYLERPSPKFPNGRWITLANGKLICEDRDYPCTDPKGETIDEPVLHRLTYARDPQLDRGVGLVHTSSTFSGWRTICPTGSWNGSASPSIPRSSSATGSSSNG